MSGSGVSSVDSSSESSDGETTDDVTTTEDSRTRHQLMGANRVNRDRINTSEQDGRDRLVAPVPNNKKGASWDNQFQF